MNPRARAQRAVPARSILARQSRGVLGRRRRSGKLRLRRLPQLGGPVQRAQKQKWFETQSEIRDRRIARLMLRIGGRRGGERRRAALIEAGARTRARVQAAEGELRRAGVPPRGLNKRIAQKLGLHPDYVRKLRGKA